MLFGEKAEDPRGKFERDKEKAVLVRKKLIEDLLSLLNPIFARRGLRFNLDFATGHTAEEDTLHGRQLGDQNTDDTRNKRGGAGFGLKGTLFFDDNQKIGDTPIMEVRFFKDFPSKSDYFLKLTREDREAGFPNSHQDSYFMFVHHWMGTLRGVGFLPISIIENWALGETQGNKNRAVAQDLHADKIKWFPIEKGDLLSDFIENLCAE